MPFLVDIARAQLIEPPQPIRFAMGEQAMQDLCDSMRQYGILDPLKVIPAGDRYEIVDGHRRFTAAGIIGLASVPCLVFLDAVQAKHAIMLHSNVVREDITAAEEGVQFLELAEQHSYSEADLCKLFGRSAAYINERCALVQRCPDLIQPVSERLMNFSQAKAIMKCTDPKWRVYLIEQATVHGASARTLQNMVDQWKTTQLLAEGKPAPHTPEYAAVYHQPPAARCPWCNRNDDVGNMVPIQIHSYHLKDLLLFLQAVGVNRPGAASALPPTPGAESAEGR